MNYIVIGAQKAGTTWIYNRFREIPEFDTFPIKELHYFDRDEEYPSKSYISSNFGIKNILNISWSKHVFLDLFVSLKKGNINDTLWKMKYYFSNPNDKWYSSLKGNRKGIVGENTPAYSILNKNDIMRIKSLYPNIKIIFSIRNPVDRILSSYKFSKRNQSNLTISLEEIKKYTNRYENEIRSDYINTIKMYLDVFPKNQFSLVFFDAILEQPKNLLEGLTNFIAPNINCSLEKCNLHSVENASKKIKIPEEINHYLENHFKLLKSELSFHFGGYCSTWISMDSNKVNCNPLYLFH